MTTTEPVLPALPVPSQAIRLTEELVAWIESVNPTAAADIRSAIAEHDGDLTKLEVERLRASRRVCLAFRNIGGRAALAGDWDRLLYSDTPALTFDTGVPPNIPTELDKDSLGYQMYLKWIVCDQNRYPIIPSHLID